MLLVILFDLIMQMINVACEEFQGIPQRRKASHIKRVDKRIELVLPVVDITFSRIVPVHRRIVFPFRGIVFLLRGIKGFTRGRLSAFRTVKI